MRWMVFGLLFSLICAFPGIAETITVPDDYPTIQAAIDAAQPGDTVYVRAGEYVEELHIKKPLTLIGEGRTQVVIRLPDPEGTAITVDIDSGEVRIKGIEVTQADTGIDVKVGTEACVEIKGVIAIENKGGIKVSGTGKFSLKESHLIDNEAVALALLGTEALITGNEFLRGGRGVVLAGPVALEFADNLIGQSKAGVVTYSKECGFNADFFRGTVVGKGNRIITLGQDLCPQYPGDPWPQGLTDRDWREKVVEAVNAFERGVKLHKAQDYKGAQLAYEQGLLLLEDAPFPLLEAYLDQNIGVVYDELGRYEEALERFFAAREVYAERGMEVDVTEVDVNIGVVYAKLGRYEEALKHFFARREVYAERGMEVDVAEVDQNIGNIYDELGRYEEALAAYERAREVFAAHKMEVDVAGVDQNIGVVYAKLGRYEEALERFFAAREVYAERGMEVDVTEVDVNIGVVYAKLGCYGEALESYKRTRKVYAAYNMEVDVAEVDTNIGVVYYELGRHLVGDLYEEALAAFEEALEILDSIPPPPGMAYSYPALRWMIYSNQGVAYEALGRYEEAISAYRKAIDVIESIRGRLKTEELKLAWGERTRHVYEYLIELLLERGEEEDKGTSALFYAERCRARTLLDLLAKGPIGTLENVVEEGIKAGVVKAEEVEKDVSEVVKELPQGTVVLEYFVTERATYVWVVRRGRIDGPVELPHGRQELLEEIIKTRKAMEDQTNSIVNRYLAELYGWLIRPLEGLLPESHEGEVHLVIIPSGPLWYLPFQALLWTDPGSWRSSYLIERYTISYAPSLTVLKYAWLNRGKARPELCLLGIADPDPKDPSIPRLPEAREEAKAAAKAFPCHELYFDKEATEDVVQSRSVSFRHLLLSTHGFFNPWNPMFSYLLLSPTQRTDGRLHAYEVFGLKLGAEIVVLSACETLLPSLRKAKEEAKVIWGSEEGKPVELSPKVLEELTTGEEIVGLTRAFFSAGAASVVSTLWSVPSKATRELMVRFYEGLREGLDKASALREAQLAVLGNKGWEHPYFWAAFCLSGDWGVPLSLGK